VAREHAMSRLERALSRYRTSLILFVITIAVLALSIWVYPSSASVSTPQPLTITLNTYQQGAFRFASVTIAERSSKADTFLVDVRLSGFGDLSQPVIDVAGPPGSSALCGGDPYCTSTYSKSMLQLNCSGCSSAPGAQSIDFSMEVHAITLGWVATDVTAEATLPNVVTASPNAQLQSACASDCPGSMPVTVMYAMPNAGNYDWASGPPPTSTSPLTWNSSLASLVGTTSVVTGTDNSSSNSASNAQFVAAALLGIAGGALIGSIQEFMDTEASDDDAEES